MNKPNDAENRNITKYKNIETISFYFLAMVYIIFFYITYLFYDNLVTNTLAKSLSNAFLIDDPNLVWITVNTPLLLKRFLLFLWVFAFIFIFIVGIIYLSIMKGTQSAYASKTSALFILGIVGGTFLLVNINLFIKIFENTIGYGWINFMASKDVDNVMNLLIEHKTYENKLILPDTKVELGFLLTIFNIDNFVNVLNNIKQTDNTYDFKLRDNESMKNEFDKLYYEDRDNTFLNNIKKELDKMEKTNSNTNIMDLVVNDLAKLVIRKNTIGHLCWVYFAGMISTIVSMKYLYKNV